MTGSEILNSERSDVKQRKVRVRISPKVPKEILVYCRTCPVNPRDLGMKQQSACMHGWVNAKGELDMEQKCDWYVAGSIKKGNNISHIDCNHD